MGSRNALRILGGLVVAAAVMGADPAFAANYPLEFANPRAGLSTNHRFRRAYPGIEYNVRAAVVGGAYPFTYSLSNAPAGMTIDAITGEIRWPSPQAAASPTITVVDAEGTRISIAWSIAVTTSGFRFIDAVNGRNALGNGCSSTCGTGTISNPWRTISDMAENGAAGDFIYFRNGTYRVTDLPREGIGGPWERVGFPEYRSPVVWMAYPGQSPVIDFSYVAGSENAPLIRFGGNNVWVDGFQTMRSRHIAFQYETEPNGTGPTFRRLRMRDIVGVDGTNASFIMTTTTPEVARYAVIQDSDFSGVVGTGVTLKIYAQHKMVIEDTIHHDSSYAIELKDDVRQFSVRHNTIYNVQNTGIGGNMQETGTHGEIMFNNVRAGLALDLNQNGMAGRIHAYRNTLVGRAQVRNTDSADGPFWIYNNVIVNSDSGTPSGSHVYHNNVSAPGQVILNDNLPGYPSANMVDAEGNLTAAYAQYIGTHGHQLAGITGPRPPTNLRIVTGQ